MRQPIISDTNRVHYSPPTKFRAPVHCVPPSYRSCISGLDACAIPGSDGVRDYSLQRPYFEELRISDWPEESHQ